LWITGDIGSIIEKRNDLSPSEMYELAEAADQELKVRRESQQIYTRKLLRGGFIDSPARPQRVVWRDPRNDYQRSNSYDQYNNAIRETRDSRSSEPVRIGNE